MKTGEKKFKAQTAFFSVMLAGLVLAVSICTITFGEEKKTPVYSVETDEKKVAISFDAAWGDEFTGGILDILDTYDVKATFFLVKFWADEYPNDVKTIAQRGHDIGNHSSTHPDMASLSEEEVTAELNGLSDSVEKIVGSRPVLFRAPYGSYSNSLLDCAEKLGYSCIQWDVETSATDKTKKYKF